MFLTILNYMLAHVPGFMRPAVNWLLDGLRNITNYVSQRWNAVGHAIDTWLTRVMFWGAAFYRACVQLAQFGVWLVRVRIPGAIATAMDIVIAAAYRAVQAARDFAAGLVAGLKEWTTYAVNWLTGKLFEVLDYASNWIDRIRETLASLIGALRHVLSGPEALAEWMIAALWRVSIRFLRSQQDRIALWLTRESVAFTRWLATELENIIVRWL